MLKLSLDFKEQMAEARRIQILMGAAQVFSKKGFHQATTKEIAAAADVSEGTIYNYFANKRELLMAMMELLARWSLEGIVHENPPDDPKEFLTTLLRDLYQFLRERGDFAAPVLAEIFTDAELRQALYRQVVYPLAAYTERFLKTHTPPSSKSHTKYIIGAYATMGAILLNFVIKANNLDPRYSQISAEAIIERIVALLLDDLYARQELVWLVS